MSCLVMFSLYFWITIHQPFHTADTGISQTTDTRGGLCEFTTVIAGRKKNDKYKVKVEYDATLTFYAR